MDKNEAIKIIVDCANEYHSNLENHNILFVFGKQPKIEVMETVFLSTNFLHLTGIKESPLLHNKTRFFYKKCLENKLSPDDFEFSSDGITELKLNVLPKIMKIYKTAKMIGDYNNCKQRLVTDKLAGNIESCLGFIMCNQFYIPNTVL